MLIPNSCNSFIKRALCGIMSSAIILSNLSMPITTFAAGEPAQTDDRAFINDTPIRLQVSKVKTAVGDHEGINPITNPAETADTITYKISGRLDGDATELVSKYGTEAIELAYASNGSYLGYGWYKGTYEYLLNRKAQNLDEDVNILFNTNGIFEGYAYVTRKLETADDVNRYVAGATMGLYEAVEIFKAPANTEDDRFEGVTVVRDAGSNNVTSVYVNKGYAGNKIEYVLEKTDESKITIDGNGHEIDDNYNYQDDINDTGDGTWIAKTIERDDTPILFYSMDDLRITTNDVYTSIWLSNSGLVDDVFGADRYEKNSRVYGFDKDGNVIDATQFNERDFSIFGFKNGDNKPIYEFVGGDFSQIKYSMPEKLIKVGAGTVIYHLDSDGNRDAMVDPQTGIAYIEQTITPPEGHDDIHGVNNGTKIFTWPVNVSHDGTGSAVGNQNGSATYSKIMTSRPAAINADTATEYTVGTYNGTSFEKSVNPVLDAYGRVIYYRRSNETYVKGEDKYDYDGDTYIGYNYSDRLDNENENAYTINDHNTLYNGDADDPFDQSTHYQYSDKQSVSLTVDTTGNYVVNGKSVVPVPTRPGYVFAGWLIAPNALVNGGTAKAYWKSTGTMSDTEKDRWYSTKGITGSTSAMTVTFDANGGEFKTGTGDIHSTDNKLYRRLGDAYLIDNVWLSGENTPNDPFDIQKIDTVENTANGTNTISGVDKTGNDAYSATNAGGQADMLKRVDAGVYIMEELSAPDGYSTALPVGVTVNKDENIQYAEMTDESIKVEFIKTDSPDDYYNNLYIDGELDKTDTLTPTKILANKGEFSYKHVTGAILSLTAADATTKKKFSDWVKVTSNTQITKKTSGVDYYFEFSSDEPLFLEGMPMGNYILKEVVTPAGYVTAPDKNITINKTNDVQVFHMNDDHIRVEVEKYFYDNGVRTIMPNAYAPTLGLYDGTNNEVATWKTDDVSDYISTNKVTKTGFLSWLISLFTNDANESFTELFTMQMNAGNTDLTTISWEAPRTATIEKTEGNNVTWLTSDGQRIVCVSGSAPDSAPAEFKEGYTNRNVTENTFSYKTTLTATKDVAASPNLSDMIWNVSNGSKMHICAYKANQTGENGRQTYTVDFEFNYKNDYTGAFVNTVSYDTITGQHRFDYLPTGTYTVKELVVPEGFTKANDKTFVVTETTDIQRFTIENDRRQLVIAKYGIDSNNKYYAGVSENEVVTDTDIKHAAVISGAELKLYHSDTAIADYENAFATTVPAGATLVDTWTSGTDGSYTKADYENEQITVDKIGDLKPHVVTNIENGFYYVVETKTPSGYKSAPVQEISVTNGSTSEVLNSIAVVNKEIPVEVKVNKKNEAGEPLANASFKVLNKTLGGAEVGTFTTDATGVGSIVLSDTGRYNIGGTLEPYTFVVIETKAPDGYALSSGEHEFTVNPSDHKDISVMFNDNDSDISNGILTVINYPSQISISKIDYDSSNFVAGATYTIYEAKLNNGKWEKTATTNPNWTWTTTTTEEKHNISGLTGGKSYVIVETGLPDGYNPSEDLFFTVSDDGANIASMWTGSDKQNFISFTSDNGAVSSVSISTKTIVATNIEITDMDTNVTLTKGLPTDGKIVLTNTDITDGKVYRIKKTVTYSNGETQTLSNSTFIAVLTDNEMVINETVPQNITVTVSDTNEPANIIATFNPDGSDYTIENPVVTSPNTMTVVGTILSKTGVDHSAVWSGDQIRYQISYKGAGQEVVIEKNPSLDYLTISPSAVLGSDGYYRLTTPNEEGKITVIAEVKAGAMGSITQKATVGETPLTYMNPIAKNAGEGIWADTSKIVLSNAVLGTDMTNQTAVFKYKITLTKADGTPLSGAYDYRTNLTSGEFEAFGAKTDFEVNLVGNDYLTISDLPYNTNYNIKLIVDNGFDFTVVNTVANGKTSKNKVSNVLFTNTRNVESDRTIFKKNTEYVINTDVNMSDEEIISMSKYGFTLGENCEVSNIIVRDEQTKVSILKINKSGEAIVGAVLGIYTITNPQKYEDANLVEKWTTAETPNMLIGVLDRNTDYMLHEITPAAGYAFTDMKFRVSGDGSIDYVTMYDKYTHVEFTKTDLTTSEEVPGAKCQIINPDGTVFAEWVSNGTPHVIEGSLIAGTTYKYHEEKAPNGYGYAEDISFTVALDGTIQKVEMKDKPFKVTFDKQDFAGNEVPGATCEIKKVNPDGTETPIDKWVSEEGSNHEMDDKLEAGETYRYHEEASPDGYGYSEDIEFTIGRDGVVTGAHYVNEKNETILYDKDGYPTTIVVTTNEDGTKEYTDNGKKIIIDENGDAVDEEGNVHAEGVGEEVPIINNVVVMKDAPTLVNIKKLSTKGEYLSGSKLQIFTKDNQPAKAVRDSKIASTEHDGYILKDEDLIISSVALSTGVDITGQLLAGKDYILREVKSPVGYAYAEDMTFSVPYLSTKNVTVLEVKDVPIEVSFTKEDYAGKEIPGATCEIKKVNPDGTETPIDKWTSDGTPKENGDKLEAGETYRYHEEESPEGYGYSEDIEFTVGKDGKVDKAHYINSDNKPILFDKDGYPTTIVVITDENGNRTYKDGDLDIIIDKNGNAVDMNGELHAEGVGYEVPVIDGVVRMKDSPTQVRLVKTSTDGTVITGGTFIILDKDKNPVLAIKDTIMDSIEHSGYILAGEELRFTATTEGANVTGQLKAGESYYLHEMHAPVGYILADDISFRVPYLCTKVVEVATMADKPTDIRIQKVSKGTTKLISGAKLQVIDKTGAVLYEWTSSSTEFVIKGQLPVGETYTLHEVSAPSGYSIAEDVTFTVQNTGDVQTITMEDPKKPSGGGGGGTPTPPQITINKTDAVQLTQLEGAEFTVYGSNGEVVKKVTTNSAGKATISGLSDGTYVIVETKAPEGYMLDNTNHHITIANRTANYSTLNIKDYKKPTIGIRKKDGDTGEPVGNTTFNIYNNDTGELVATGTVDSEGRYLFIPDTFGSYSIKEISTDDDYVLTNDSVVFVLEPGKDVQGSTTYYNYKKKPIVGRITARYDNGADELGFGWYDRNGKWHRFGKIPGLGDFNSSLPTLMLLLLSGMCIVVLKKKKKNGGVK